MTAPDTSMSLPNWGSVLAVVAHPDDESFGLGAVLSRFAASGARTSVLCFTHGEASSLHGVPGDLHVVRAHELSDAAAALGVGSVRLLSYVDGELASAALDALRSDVLTEVDAVHADGLLVFDANGVTGHPDHVQATRAAAAAGAEQGLPVLGWAVPDAVADILAHEHDTRFLGRSPAQVDLVIPVDRTRQLAAVACHPSQAVPGSVLWRRLELSGAHEHLRWVRPSDTAPERPVD